MNGNYMYQAYDGSQNQYQNTIDPAMRNRSNFINVPNNNRNIQYQQSDMNNPYNYSFLNNPPPMNGSMMINQCPQSLPPNTKDNSNMQFTINKGAANVPSHLSSPYRRQDNKNNSGYSSGGKNNKNSSSSTNTAKSPLNDNWNMDFNNSQGNWNPHINIPIGGINQQSNWEDVSRSLPQNTNNYRNNSRNNFHDMSIPQNTNTSYSQQRSDIRNVKFPNMNQPQSNQNIPVISGNDMNSGQYNPQLNQYGASLSRSNSNNYFNNSTVPMNTSAPKQGMGSKSTKSYGGRVNYNYNNNQNSNRNIVTQNNLFPGKVGMFNVTEDSYWKNPNEENMRKQKDNGTSIWGNPDKQNTLPIKRWAMANIPDLVEGNDPSDTSSPPNPSCKVIVAVGWGDFDRKDEKKIPKDTCKVVDDGNLYNRDENRWSPGSGKGSNFETFGSSHGSDWNLSGNPNNIYTDMIRGFQGNNMPNPSDNHSLSSTTQELLKLAVSKNLINRNLLPKFYDPQSSVLLNNLLSLISQAVMLDDKLESIRRLEMGPTNDYEMKQRHNALIVEIAKIKNEIVMVSENLNNRTFGNTLSVNGNLPPNHLINNVHKDINLAAFTDEYLFENISSTPNFHFDSATAAVSRSLANLDISGNGDETSDHLFHSDVWK
uniref:YTH domain-containing protein n=1 Tax=Strongyloides venezuelensis TaxID=75913 RepID=A0A0K0EVH1_STRVS